MKNVYFLFFSLFSLSFARSQPLLSQDFEQPSFPPADWTLINGNAPAGYNWTRNTDPNLAYVNNFQKPYPAFMGQGSMVYETDVTDAKAWAVTPPLALTNGTSYTLTFYYAVFSSQYPEKLKITVGNAATIEAQTTVLWDNNGGIELANDSAWTKATIHYIPALSGDFYFGFNCYSDANRYALLIDNIKVEAAPTAAPPCAALTGPADGAAGVTAPQALFTWHSAAAASEYIFKFGTIAAPDSIGSSEERFAYQSDLSYNTTYYWSVVPKNDAGSASGCPVYSFTTQAAPPPPANDNCGGAIQLNAGSSILASTKNGSESIPAEACNGDAGDANDDVWFTFTASQSGDATITLTPDLMFDGVINAYSGTCGSLTTIACADNGIDGEPETLILSNLTAGQTYYLRVYGYGNAGKDGSFTLTASGTALPVTIANFRGVLNGFENVLSWTTLTEQNNNGFQLERSADGKNFNMLTFIDSKAAEGNSSAPLVYQFHDAQPLIGNNYYRLKQVDKDGKSATSGIVLLKRIQTNAFALPNIYPNPATSNVKLVITTPAATKVNVTVTDLAGKSLMQQVAQLTVGENNLLLNVNKLAKGSYFVKAVFANSMQTAVSRFIKQ